ncbi:MAG: UDP-N-acetylmuramoyl-tripeptide--D-alanyl-D-alanine ligase [Spirochaetales bacterium]|nr:UDP-N-acetylmuramoyl-tripeptide--D-alanyl-D-alanine ligase [Spirochaetales bacterium]
MKPLPLATWKTLLDSAILRGRLADWERVTSLVVDSREAQEGTLFTALPGERTDGHLFVRQAQLQGAAAILARLDRRELAEKQLEGVKETAVAFVQEPLDLMADLARAHLSRLPGLKRLGVTGSNGKTTTKEMLLAVFSRNASTWATPGNLNSEIGLPMASLSVTEQHRWAVFEMGINHAGEMDRLQRAVFPDLAIVTNIGTAHIGILGSREGIALEKKKIFSLSGQNSVAVLPAACDLLSVLVEGFSGKVVVFGVDDPEFSFLSDQGLEGSLFTWKGRRIWLKLPGKVNVLNALAVAKSADVLGLPVSDVVDGLESVEASFGRSQVLRGVVDLVLDCYNANLDSMSSLLDSLPGFQARGKKVAVLGSMKELGQETESLHRELGRRASTSGVDSLFWFGEETQPAFESARQAGYAGKMAWTTDFDQLKAWLTSEVKEGDLVVLKASRSMELERLTELWKVQNGKGDHVL